MRSSRVAAFAGGAVVGILGGLIGLGGAEFRLPLLIGPFGFAALEAVIVNKALSLVVVASALPARASSVPLRDVLAHWPIIVNLLAGSVLGAWYAADWATRVRSHTLYRVIAVLLVVMALLLLFGHSTGGSTEAALRGAPLIVVGALAGLSVGIVAAILGVAGGEMLIPILVLLFAVPIQLAGSLSLAISLPTMLASFARYSRDQSFGILRRNLSFLAAMALGSIVGTVLGGLLLGVVPQSALIPILALILLVSALKIWRHQQTPVGTAAPTLSR